MADNVNAEDHSREDLNKLAVEAGLTDAADYKNKPAVADAINRVNGGEDAAAVNAELAPSNGADDEDGSDASSTPKSSTPAARQSGKKVNAINGGHPTQFDETGNPVYDPNQV